MSRFGGKWTVYEIESLDTGRVYVGCTGSTLDHRWAGHRNYAKVAAHPLYADMARFGVDRFILTPVRDFGADRTAAFAFECARMKEITDPYNIHGRNTQLMRALPCAEQMQARKGPQ